MLRLACFVALLAGMKTDSWSVPPRSVDHFQIEEEKQGISRSDKQRNTKQAPPLKNEVETEDRNPNTDQIGGESKKAENHIVSQSNWINIFLMLATGGLVYLGIRQDNHFRLIERAWLFAGPNPKGVEALENVRRFQLNIHNYGKTPGFLKKFYWDEIAEEPLSAEVHYTGDAHMIDTVFGAGEIGPLHPYFCSVRVRAYFVGYIVYEDIFKKRHTSRFCLRVGADRFEHAGHPAWNNSD